MKNIVMHYAPPGPDWLRIGDSEYARGYPICCSGDRAIAAKRRGATTFRVDDVTCKRCLRKLASGDRE